MAHLPTRNIAIAAGTVMVAALLPLCVFGCAPQKATDSAPSENTGQEEEGPAMTGAFTFAADADCTTCHSNEGASLEDATMPAAQHSGQACTTCHGDTDGLAAAHDGVEYGDKTPKRLKTTSIDTEACFTCHGSQEELAAKTEASTVLTDTNGTVVNPHDLPVNDDHATVDCGSCHSMHAADPLEQTASKACRGCHHMDVYECNTCHE